MITCIVCGREMVDNGYVRHLRTKACKKLQEKQGFIQGKDENEYEFFNRIRNFDNYNKESHKKLNKNTGLVPRADSSMRAEPHIDIEIKDRPILEDDREIIVRDACVQTDDVVIISIEEFKEYRRFKEQKEKKINEIKKMMLEMNINENELK